MNNEIYIKCFDENNKIRAVTLHFIIIFSFFGEDVIIKYSKGSPEYEEMRQSKSASENKEISERLNSNKKYLEFEPKYYSIRGKIGITIKQEHYNPNIGEYVYINNTPAPDGKYKIGFLTYIYIEDSRISAIKMFWFMLFKLNHKNTLIFCNASALCEIGVFSSKDISANVLL